MFLPDLVNKYVAYYDSTDSTLFFCLFQHFDKCIKSVQLSFCHLLTPNRIKFQTLSNQNLHFLSHASETPVRPENNSDPGLTILSMFPVWWGFWVMMHTHCGPSTSRGTDNTWCQDLPLAFHAIPCIPAHTFPRSENSRDMSMQLIVFQLTK